MGVLRHGKCTLRDPIHFVLVKCTTFAELNPILAKFGMLIPKMSVFAVALHTFHKI